MGGVRGLSPVRDVRDCKKILGDLSPVRDVRGLRGVGDSCIKKYAIAYLNVHMRI